MYNKTIIRFGFCDIQNNRGLGKGYQPQPSLRLITPTSNSIILDITKTSSNNCLLLLIIMRHFTRPLGQRSSVTQGQQKQPLNFPTPT